MGGASVSISLAARTLGVGINSNKATWAASERRFIDAGAFFLLLIFRFPSKHESNGLCCDPFAAIRPSYENKNQFA